MASGAYTTSVRQSLRNKGIADDEITYDQPTNTVNVRGQSFMKPAKNISGTTFDTQGNFDNAWNQYNKQQTQPPVTANPTTAQPSYSAAINNPYDNQYNEQLKALMQAAQNPKPVDVNSIYSSPQWAAIQAQQQRGAQQGIRSAQESMGSAGFGRSTALGERVQGIQNQANEYLQTQALPQLIAQQQAAQQQQYQNQLGMLNQLREQQGLYDTRYNTANNLALQQGELTGNYSNPNTDAIRQLMDINSGKWATAAPDEQRRLHDENVRLAGTIGGRDTTGEGDYEFAPQRTLQAQQLDRRNFESDREFELAKGQQEWENAFKEGQFNEDVAQRAWENAFKEKDFAQSMKDAAASRGLQWASLSQRDKEFVADQTFREKKFTFEKEQAEGKQKNYDENPEFAQDVADPDTADLLVSNPKAYIDAYGTKGYLELRKIFKIEN